MKRKFLIYILPVFLLYSCFSIKPGTTKTGKNLWEEFFVAPGVMQYFIKPLVFQDHDRQFIPDFTFRNGNDSVSVNFSITDSRKVLLPGKIYFRNSKDTLQVNALRTLIISNTDRKFKLRMTGKLAYNKFAGLFRDTNWSIFLSDSQNNKTYYPSDKTKASLKKIEISLVDAIQ
jgi:hypothetical protein